jgi:SAM-dependent methyltransferase
MGASFAREMPDEGAAELERSEFSERQFDEAYPEGVEQHFWHLARNRIVEATLRKGFNGKGRILEVGCGTGLVLRYLRGRGLDCWGCDLSCPRVSDAIRPFVFINQDFRTLDVSFRREICALLLLDVLEHVPDDAGFLRALAECFPKCESLVLTVPARTELWSNYDDHYGHLRRYDRTSLAATVDRGGFALVHQGYFFHELYLPLLAATKLAGGRDPEWRPPTRASARLHRFIATFSGLCYTIIPRSLPGTSLIALTAPNGLIN